MAHPATAEAGAAAKAGAVAESQAEEGSRSVCEVDHVVVAAEDAHEVHLRVVSTVRIPSVPARLPTDVPKNAPPRSVPPLPLDPFPRALPPFILPVPVSLYELSPASPETGGKGVARAAAPPTGHRITCASPTPDHVGPGPRPAGSSR